MQMAKNDALHTRPIYKPQKYCVPAARQNCVANQDVKSTKKHSERLQSLNKMTFNNYCTTIITESSDK